MKKFLLLSSILGLLILATSCNSAPAENNASTSEEPVTTEPKSKIEETAAPAEANSETNAGTYVVYSESDFAAAADTKRVLFFHASWCPSCKSTNAEFEASSDKIPSEVTIFKVDYDSYDDLKSKYGITYQHTFVLVNENGEEIKKWNGGDLEALIDNI